MRFRRFLAYIVMVLTVICTIGFNTSRLLDSKTNTMEFSKGTQLVYEITKRDNTAYDQNYYPNLARAQNLDLYDIDVQSVVMKRLEIAGVRNAEVSLVKGGDDNRGYQLRVNFSPLSTNELSNVKNILSMTGSLSVVVTGDDYYFTVDKGELLNASRIADLIYDGTTPVPVLNVANTDDYDKLVDEAKKAYDNHKNDTTTSSDNVSSLIKRSSVKRAAEGEEEESEEDKKGQGTVYLWYNKTVNDTFDLAFGKNSKYKVQEVNDKVLLPLYTTDYDSTTKQWKITKDKDGNDFNVSTARAFVNMLNCTDYGFDIRYLYSNSMTVPFGKNSNTTAIIAIPVAIGIVSLILILLYGFAGFNASLSLFLTAFLSMVLFVTLGFEFSIAGIIGFVVILALSVFMSVSYISRTRLELKKGRRIEKANKEGFRKSVILSLDVTAVTFFGSIFSFILAKGMYQTFFGMLIVGSLVAFLITVFLNYGLNYFLCKGVSTSKMPYFSWPFLSLIEKKKKEVNLDLATCNKKRFTLKTLLVTGFLPLVLLAVVLPSAYAIKGDGHLFNNSDDFKTTYVLNIDFRMNTEKYEKLETDRDYIQYIKDLGKSSEFGKFLALEYGEEAGEEYKDLPVFYFSSDDLYTNILEKNDEKNLKYYVKSFSLKVDRDLSKVVVFSDGMTVTDSISLAMVKQNITSNDVEICPGLDKNYVSEDFLVGCFVNQPLVISYYTGNLILMFFLFSIFASIYTLIRFGLSTFITHVTSGTLLSASVISLLALFQIPYNGFTGFAVLSAIVIFNVLIVSIFGKNRAHIKEKGLKGIASRDDKACTINTIFKESLPSNIALLLSSVLLLISILPIYTSTLMSPFSIYLISIVPIIVVSVLFSLPLFYILSTHISYSYIKNKYIEFIDRHKKNKEEKVIKLQKEIKYVDEDENHETIIPGMNDFRF